MSHMVREKVAKGTLTQIEAGLIFVADRKARELERALLAECAASPPTSKPAPITSTSPLMRRFFSPKGGRASAPLLSSPPHVSPPGLGEARRDHSRHRVRPAFAPTDFVMSGKAFNTGPRVPGTDCYGPANARNRSGSLVSPPASPIAGSSRPRSNTIAAGVGVGSPHCLDDTVLPHYGESPERRTARAAMEPTRYGCQRAGCGVFLGARDIPEHPHKNSADKMTHQDAPVTL